MPYIRDLAARTLHTFWELLRIMVPIMVALRIAESYGLIAWISPWISPVTTLVNLPPEAAIISATSIFIGLYGAIAAMPLLAGYELTTAQITSLCAILLLAHAIPIEQAIVRKAGSSFWGTSLLRLASAFLAAWLIHKFSQLTGLMSTPQSLEHFKALGQPSASHADWLLASLQALLILLAILLALLALLDIMDKTGLTALINKLLAPIIRLSGLDQSVVPITTTGILLGLAYGGGLIIAHAKDPNISRRAKFYALCWLSLCHGLIEDTALMVALGGDIWTLLFGRILLTLIIVRLLILWFERPAARKAYEETARAE